MNATCSRSTQSWHLLSPDHSLRPTNRDTGDKARWGRRCGGCRRHRRLTSALTSFKSHSSVTFTAMVFVSLGSAIFTETGGEMAERSKALS
jgi:hypothetical protein